MNEEIKTSKGRPKGSKNASTIKKEKNPKNYKYTRKHIYKVGDQVEYIWIGQLKLGKIIKLTLTDVGNIKVATYTIKDSINNLVNPYIGVNKDMKFGNILQKV